MDDEECLQRYGTPLKLLEKEEAPAKKPIAIEDQIVTDENGKRRFHGAFTGGFSAGFWNTVGSLEGWTPQSFKSSRKERAVKPTQQKPEDFMDQEDLGEFGIAPQGVRTRDEFAKDETGASGSRKRKLMQPGMESGAIPGVPVLEQLLRPVKDKVAVRILKSMGWKPGQGVGPRQTRTEKHQAKTRNNREMYLRQHYGEEDVVSSKKERSDGEQSAADDDDEYDDDEITFAPDDYEPIFYTIKDNRYGLSYTGLDRAPVLSETVVDKKNIAKHFDLFGPLEVLDKNKKLSITGQAFGVGALEDDDDDDIYARDDMTRYDFSLGDKKPKQKKIEHVQDRRIIEGFVEDKEDIAYNEPYSIDLPRDFVPRNWAVRRSRFAPLDAARLKELDAGKEYKKSGLGRHDLDPNKRAVILGEQVPSNVVEKPITTEPVTKKIVDRTKDLLERITARSSNFTRGGIITAEGEEKLKLPTGEEVSANVLQENAELLAKAENKTKNLPNTQSGSFKPFLGNESKQNRYEQFLSSKLTNELEITEFLNHIQPLNLSAWDREMEKKEFIQARSIYKPLGGIMSERFVSEATIEVAKIEPVVKPTVEKKIVMERTKSTWKPNALLCKRYNIAEPFGGAMIDTEKELKKKPKLSVFDYLESSMNTKKNFQSPVIIPKHIEKPIPVVAPTISVELQPPQAELSTEEISAKIVEVKPKTKNAVPTVQHAPRTELEKRIEEYKDKPISEKSELFKCIFDDSDEDEAIDINNKDDANADGRRAQMTAELNLPVSKKPMSAASQNLERNTSPPRGIFADFFGVTEKKKQIMPDADETTSIQPKTTSINIPPKITFKHKNERLSKNETKTTSPVDDSTSIEEDFYGPKIPVHILKSPTTTSAPSIEADFDAKLLKLWSARNLLKRSKNADQDEDKWVEKRPKTVISDNESDSSSNSSDNRAAHKHKSTKAKKHKSKSSHKKAKKKSKKKSKDRDKTHKSKRRKN